MVVKDGVDFDSLDGEPVTLMFLIAAPNTEDNIHLDVLSKLSVLLMNEEFTEALRNAETVEEFMGIINDADEKKQELMKDLREKERQQKKRPEERLRFLQSHPARPELHIRIWRLKELKKLQKQKTVQ